MIAQIRLTQEIIGRLNWQKEEESLLKSLFKIVKRIVSPQIGTLYKCLSIKRHLHTMLELINPLHVAIRCNNYKAVVHICGGCWASDTSNNLESCFKI